MATNHHNIHDYHVASYLGKWFDHERRAIALSVLGSMADREDDHSPRRELQLPALSPRLPAAPTAEDDDRWSRLKVGQGRRKFHRHNTAESVQPLVATPAPPPRTEPPLSPSHVGKRTFQRPSDLAASIVFGNSWEDRIRIPQPPPQATGTPRWTRNTLPDTDAKGRLTDPASLAIDNPRLTQKRHFSGVKR
eukprot:TRINITY_DN6368_c0_g1_i1.p1 TRINITY_DN6368_c0_g1~~TRINITY_DN6368_c0_g1_i1.p1  ORF type:complete len:192 (+),score=0.85 TRINITY_DN6368_c0_g1_i1:65-640(+)